MYVNMTSLVCASPVACGTCGLVGVAVGCGVGPLLSDSYTLTQTEAIYFCIVYTVYY